VLVPEAGHMVMLEQPEIVARELLNFLARLN
jgi:pimeloyl-ACP methyl ester carboxylesterase